MKRARLTHPKHYRKPSRKLWNASIQTIPCLLYTSQVSIPASVPLKEFDYNAEVEIINPVADTVATATFQGAEVDWYIKADDIVLKKGAAMNPQPPKKDAPPVK